MNKTKETHLQNCIQTTQSRLLVAKRNNETHLINALEREIKYYEEQLCQSL
ncbi:MAG: hypothetical protein R3321_00195 [Nitrososphaeraceae archaeon]|nr:hypothetical protein [Nitrososphaeraceae archaeon]